jgi:arylsulfatase A-like enzyme
LSNPPSEPWCLVVSLVNPHDVHLGFLAQDGTFYDPSLYPSEVPAPSDVGQSLATMPRGQAYYTWASRSAKTADQQNFLNFYAYLMQYVDGQINSILRAMHAILDQTLIIRFADHGEMGLSHGLVEKFVSAYSQATHVPFIVSNPIAYPGGQTTAAMASTADLVPTLASLLGVRDQFQNKFVGADLTSVLNDPTTPGQTYVHYTYDDLSSSAPSVIRTVRSSEWVYSVYLQSVMSSTSGYSDADWEMYDLTNDPGEDSNVAGQSAYGAQQTMLDQELRSQMQAKNTAPAWFPANWPPQATTGSRGGPPPISTSIASLEGISPAQTLELQYIGVRTSADLIARASDLARRAALATLAPGIDAETLDRLVASARRCAGTE